MRSNLKILPALAITVASACLIAVDKKDTLAAEGEIEGADCDLVQSLRAGVLSRDAISKLGDTAGFRIYEGNPVLAPGASGEWDAGAIGSTTVIRVGDVFHMYYEAWAETEESAGLDFRSLQIGHAVSLDGIHWKKNPANPVLAKGSAGEWDADGTWDPFAIHEDGIFKLWYGGGFDRHCDYGYAESPDGTQFKKRGRVSHIGQLSDGHVVHRLGAEPYLLFYFDKRYEPRNSLFRVESPDEISFDFSAATPIVIDGERTDAMYKFSHVFVDDGVWYMLYANFVRPKAADSSTRLARSNDGIHWTSINKSLLPGDDAEVVSLDDSLHLIFFSRRGLYNQPQCDVRLAIYQGSWDALQDETLLNTGE